MNNLSYTLNNNDNHTESLESFKHIVNSNHHHHHDQDYGFNNVDFESQPHNPVFIFMFIVYSISTFTGIASNLIVILVYLLGNSNKSDISRFLFNLAVADFLMSTVCMPFTFAQALLKRWIFGEIICPLVLFKQVFSVSLSIYTMVIIGIDRYYAIKSPLKNRASNKTKKNKLAILFVWIISIGLGSVQLFVAKMEELPDYFTHSSSVPNNETISNFTTVLMTTNKRYTCNEVWDSIEKQQTYTLFNFFAVYLIPVFILGYTYTCIACIIKQAAHPGNADVSRDLNYTKSKKKVIKMLITLVCVFTLCWLPLHMFILMKDFTNWIDSMPYALWFYYTAHWLAMANCTINPFIYGYSNKKFRADVYSIFCCQCKKRRDWKRQQTSKHRRAILGKLSVTTKNDYFNTNSNTNKQYNQTNYNRNKDIKLRFNENS